MGKVPTLVDGDTVVSEVSATCCYLADAYPKAGLAPAVTDKLRGPYLKWLFFVPSCVEPAVLDKAMNRPPAPRSTAGWADYDTVVSVLREATGKASPYLARRTLHRRRCGGRRQPAVADAVQALPDLPEFVAYTQRLAERPALQRQLARDEAYARQAGG